MLMASGISGFLVNNKYAGTTSLLLRDFLGPKWCDQPSSPIFGLKLTFPPKSIETTSKQTLPTYIHGAWKNLEDVFPIFRLVDFLASHVGSEVGHG